MGFFQKLKKYLHATLQQTVKKSNYEGVQSNCSSKTVIFKPKVIAF